MLAAIILALLSYFTSKKSGASDKTAMLTAAGVGAGTYYVATQTEWGKENLDWFESPADTGGKVTSSPVTTTGGEPVKNPDGSVIGTIVGGTADVLKEWGGTGTAAVIGAGTLAVSSEWRKYIPWLIVGGGILLLTR